MTKKGNVVQVEFYNNRYIPANGYFRIGRKVILTKRSSSNLWIQNY